MVSRYSEIQSWPDTAIQASGAWPQGEGLRGAVETPTCLQGHRWDSYKTEIYWVGYTQSVNTLCHQLGLSCWRLSKRTKIFANLNVIFQKLNIFPTPPKLGRGLRAPLILYIASAKKPRLASVRPELNRTVVPSQSIGTLCISSSTTLCLKKPAPLRQLSA